MLFGNPPVLPLSEESRFLAVWLNSLDKPGPSPTPLQRGSSSVVDYQSMQPLDLLLDSGV